MKARDVYRDCLYAKKCLEQALDQHQLEDAKLFWFAALAMLRAIGHVLHNVDVPLRGVAFHKAVNERFEFWKHHDPIFRDFIELERNNILKEYKSSLSEQTFEEESFLLTESGDRLVTEAGEALVIDVTTVTTLVKGNGVYSGISPTDALSRALAWWDKELLELEQI